MNKQFIKEINEDFYNKNKDKYQFIHTGFFNGNHILFIGSNPGNPFDEKQKQMVADSNIGTYEERESKYQNIIKNTKITRFINDICGENWSHISYTNLVKCPTPNNEAPSRELIDEFKPFLLRQLLLVNPTLVILLGKLVGSEFGIYKFYELNKLNGINYVMLPHPSYLFQYTKYDDEIIKINKVIDDILKMNALIKVTNYQVIYRDAKFNKQICEHGEKLDYCFVKTSRKTEYKSFDNYHLEKINKQFADDNTSYEKHLRNKDYFYYKNIDKISHARMIRYMLFDLENDFCNDVVNPIKPITCIGFYDNLLDKYSVFVYKFSKEQNIIYDNKKSNIFEYDDEREMLEGFLNVMKDFDVICGWYSNNFDIPYLLNRAQILGIDLNQYLKSLKIEIKENKDIRIYQQSVIFYDALEFYKRNTYFNKPPSYSLNAVAVHLFGEKYKKLDSSSNVGVLWRNDINKLIDYNLKDVELLKMIVDAVNIIDYPLQFQQVCPQDFENVFFNSFTIENLLHQKYWKKNIFFPTKIEHIKLDYEGGLVIDPFPKLHKNVAAYDYSGQYTNTYISMNYSPDTIIGEKKFVENNIEDIKKDLVERFELDSSILNLSKEDFCKQCVLTKNDFGEFYFMPSNWKIGVLPALEKEMLIHRKTYTDLRDSYDSDSLEYDILDNIQGNFKTILNSIYGVAAFKKFILFNVNIPASITYTARQLNLWVQELAKQQQLLVVAGDTDSVFISFDDNLSNEDFLKKGEEFNEVINKSFPEFMKKFTSNEYVINNHTHKVEFEKAYSKLLLTNTKKRYFGYLTMYKKKLLKEEKMHVVGFESRMSSLPKYFNLVLLDMYKLFLEDNSSAKIRELYQKIKKEIRNVPIQDLLISIKLSRDIDKYKNIPIHVRALNNSNAKIKRGEYVKMVYTDDANEVLHFDESLNLNYKIDYDKYLEKFFVNKISLIDDKISVHPTLKDWLS